jgi:hypothetical protein
MRVGVPPKNAGRSLPLRLWGAVGVALAAFLAYVLGATPAAYPLDSAELATAAFGLGVAHPPGEETTLLFAKLFTLLPLGGTAFKVALSQAAAGALAAMMVFLLVLELTDRLDAAVDGAHEASRILIAAAAALAFAYAPGVVIVSNRAEVYAVQTALSLEALWFAVRAQARGDARLALLAALLIGLGVGNHSLVAGLAGLGAVAAALPVLFRSERRARFVALSLAAFAAGMLVHAYLPLRTAALQGTAAGIDNVLWGDARTLPGLWWVVSAKTFAEKAGIVHGNASPSDLPFMLIEELGMVFALVAPAGAYLLLRRRPSRAAGVAVLVSMAGSMAAGLAGGLDPGNPDIRGYLGPAIACLAVLSGSALTIGLAVFRLRRARALLAAAFLVGALTCFPNPNRYPGLADARAAENEVRDWLVDLPPRASLFTSHFETGFLVGYLRFVEGLRPDVAWAHLAFANGVGYRDRIQATEPELVPVIDAWRSHRDLLAAWGDLDGRRPVRIEPDGVLGRDVWRRLAPAGELWSLAKNLSPEDVPPLPAWMQDEAARDPQVRAYLAWRNYTDARWSCGLGLFERARARFGELGKLVPEDSSFRELQHGCH